MGIRTLFTRFNRRSKKDSHATTDDPCELNNSPRSEKLVESRNEGDAYSEKDDIEKASVTRYSKKGHVDKASVTKYSKGGHVQNASLAKVKQGEGGKDRKGKDREPTTDYSLYNDDKGTSLNIVKQNYGYLSIFFSLVQTGILITMMIMCRVAPFDMNPMIGPYPDSLSYWGGKNAYSILYDKEWWRLFTPILLHSGVFHLLCNIVLQLDSGAFYEKEWGSLAWLVIYIGSAAGGTIFSTVINPDAIGVGSSGSICGIFGAKIAETFCRCCESRKTEHHQKSFGMLMKNFASTTFSVIMILVLGFIPFVDWATHAGGAVSGFAIGMMIFSLKIKAPRWRVLWFLFGLIVAAMLYGMSILYLLQAAKHQVAMELSDVCGYYTEIYENYSCNCRLAHDQDED